MPLATWIKERQRRRGDDLNILKLTPSVSLITSHLHNDRFWVGPPLGTEQEVAVITQSSCRAHSQNSTNSVIHYQQMKDFHTNYEKRVSRNICFKGTSVIIENTLNAIKQLELIIALKMFRFLITMELVNIFTFRELFLSEINTIFYDSSLNHMNLWKTFLGFFPSARYV